ncbi:tyrosine-type recombinase/integrase [Paenibacillus mesotrionivorans]|uniref:Tyrosine-type recombinase/integrase n=1 Tax=Paenibacillus mesotrionivorans TaxID=3160968 RepID=A0ACC7P0C9_9BACL
MKGSLLKRGNYWYIIVETKDESGKRKQKWINTKCEKKPDAEKILRETLTKIDNNSFVQPQRKLAFTDFMLDWLHNVIKSNVEETTWEGYEMIVTKHIIPYFKSKNNLLLQEIQPIHLQKYYDTKHQGDQASGKEGLSAKTLRRHHANIKSALDFAVRMNLIPFNPADRIVLPKQEKYNASYYPVDRLEELFEACSGTAIESAVFIAAHYGLRRSEVLGLKWDCINFEEKTISIKEVRVKIGKKVVVKKPKSESSQRTLPLMDNIERYLKNLKKQRKRDKLLFGEDYDDSGLVCCWPNGSPIKSEYLNHKFKEILEKNKLPHIRFHDLRHSTASYLIKHGVSLKEIQVWLGHSTITLTADTYSHLDMETKKDTAQRINDLFSKEAKGVAQ